MGLEGLSEATQCVEQRGGAYVQKLFTLRLSHIIIQEVIGKFNLLFNCVVHW
jgi:hypothetical protein